jgi:hypothetical protein
MLKSTSRALGELLSDPGPERLRRAMAAMLRMTRSNIDELQRAVEGR